MLICSPVDDYRILYVFVNDDKVPYSFSFVENYPVNKKTIWVEVEDEEPDDDGDIRVDEVEVRVIPTNAWRLIRFKHASEAKRFAKVIEDYYGKEKL